MTVEGLAQLPTPLVPPKRLELELGRWQPLLRCRRRKLLRRPPLLEAQLEALPRLAPPEPCVRPCRVAQPEPWSPPPPPSTEWTRRATGAKKKHQEPARFRGVNELRGLTTLNSIHAIQLLPTLICIRGADGSGCEPARLRPELVEQGAKMSAYRPSRRPKCAAPTGCCARKSTRTSSRRP